MKKPYDNKQLPISKRIDEFVKENGLSNEIREWILKISNSSYMRGFADCDRIQFENKRNAIR